MFHVQKPTLDHVGSTLAFVLLLGTWCVAYVTFVPAEPAQHRAVQFAQVSR